MSNRTLIIGAAALAFLYYMGKTVMDLNRLLFQIAGFRNFNSSSGAVSVTVDILIQNPTGSSFPLYDTTMNATVLINNFAVGQTTTNINALLVPGQQIIVPLTITMSATNFAGGVAALLASFQTKGTVINILGTVSVKGVPLPIDLIYKY